jgi:hypothetical protein
MIFQEPAEPVMRLTAPSTISTVVCFRCSIFMGLGLPQFRQEGQWRYYGTFIPFVVKLSNAQDVFVPLNNSMAFAITMIGSAIS